MKTFWICALLVASTCYHAKAQVPDDYEDYYNYDNFEDLEKRIDEEINKLNEKTDIDNDLKVEEEIQQFRAGEDNSDVVDDPKDIIDNIDDYQFEDNRDKSKEENGDVKDVSENNGDSLEEPIEKFGNNDYDAENRPEPDDKTAPRLTNEDYALLWGDDSVAPLPVPESPETDDDKDKAILEETQKLLEEEDADNFEDEIKKVIEEAGLKTDDQPNLDDIVQETKKLLADNDDSFNNDESAVKVDAIETDNVDKDKKDVEPEVEEKVENKDENDEEDTVDKAYADLNADLDKLFATLDKLREDPDNDDDLESMDKALEEANNFFEDDNNDLDDKNLEGSEELVEDTKEDGAIDLEKLLDDILSENDMKADGNLEPMINDALNEPNPDDTIEKDVESLDSKLKPILYLNDALIDETKDSETLEDTDENAEKAAISDNASVEKEPEVKTTSIDELTSSELDDLVSQFSIMHGEDLDVHSKNFEKDVAPVHIKLSLDEPTIITSPDYPNNYPTNNIVDWIVEGDGVGIELNITEFAVNGALGDYLLIKPGGIDNSGHDGLLFTYRLSSERRFRFTDVDRMFIRFESKPGNMFFKGFVLSAKMIAPIPEGPEPVPEPEAVLAPPHSTYTLTLAVPVRDFLDMKEDFRLLLADMAEEYIKDNNISPGWNTTSEVTQITHVGLCPISWPNYEGCSAVTYGVPLVHEEAEEDHRLNVGDLVEMWVAYSKRDPFALRLSRMGISEFNPPDSSALTAWLVIAGGVVISMAMLAFVLWRYSCFEDYTRMQAYSETASVQDEKRRLELYPTPHQTLPPLYAESEYKWQDDATRVDMGGFANRSYARENMYDFESDEEVAPRDRNGAVTEKDIFSNV